MRPTGHSPTRSRKRRLRVWALLLTPPVLAVAVAMGVPHVRDTGTLLAGLTPGAYAAAAAALVAEAGSLLCVSALTRTLLPSPAPAFGTVFAVDLLALGVRSILPGGAATSAGLRISLFRRLGVPPVGAASAASLQVVVLNLTLSLVFVVGLLADGVGAAPVQVVLGLAMVLLLVVGAGTAAWSLLRHHVRTREAVVRYSRSISRVIPALTPEAAGAYVDALSDGLRGIDAGRGATRAVLSSAGSWAADLAAFRLMLDAAGVRVGWGATVLAYALANLLATLPVTPGALGIVEAVTVTVLHAAGVPTAAALLGVIGWRVVEFWLPIPAAAIASPFVAVAAGRRRRDQRGTLGTSAHAAVRP